eukprot:TRINITY_DN3704_c0_g1_i1.p1 TRINITY_DN3704_c0_g1~~TRINITY_DN3704_c0_g1_i1.p1  ORF type:complete len:808 (+),score=208.35 TRINITY_DN3704_c0_g1_i1:51-2474(+)
MRGAQAAGLWLVLLCGLVSATAAPPTSTPEVQLCPEHTDNPDSERRATLLGVYASVLLLVSIVCFVGAAVASKRENRAVFEAADLAAYCTLWFAVSISFTLYNKWLFKDWDDGNFCFPLTTTFVHMFVKGAISAYVVVGRRLPMRMPLRNWLLKACPVGAATALDIALSNQAFLYIDVSFYTIIKTSVLVWVFCFSLLLRLQRFSLPLLASVMVIVLGIVLATLGQGTRFDVRGFLLVLGASLLAGLRWTLTESLLRDVTDKSTVGGAFQAVYWFSPAAVLTMVPVMMQEFDRLSRWEDITDNGVASKGMIVAGGAVACILIVAELAVVSRASALTLSVAGYVKEILTIILSVAVFGDKFTIVNGLGLLCAMGGCIVYTRLRRASGTEYRQIGEEGTPPASARQPAPAVSAAAAPAEQLQLRAQQHESDRSRHLTPESISGVTAEGLVWAEAHMVGKRPAMEDAHCIRQMDSPLGTYHFFGVFDGHGDRGVVSRAVATGVGVGGESLCDCIVSSLDWESGQIRAAIEGGIAQIDSRLRTHLVPIRRTPNAWDHGSCCCAAVGKPGEVWLANLGDSMAVVYDPDFNPVACTVMHKPGDPDERERIERNGGKVVEFGCPRVTLANGPCDSYLAVARALGDHFLKPAVGSEPEVFSTELPDGGWVLVACDGLWDAPMTPKGTGKRLRTAVPIAAEVASGATANVDAGRAGERLRNCFQEMDLQGAAEEQQLAAVLEVLVASAVASLDNVSAILVRIPPAPTRGVPAAAAALPSAASPPADAPSADASPPTASPPAAAAAQDLSDTEMTER